MYTHVIIVKRQDCVCCDVCGISLFPGSHYGDCEPAEAVEGVLNKNVMGGLGKVNCCLIVMSTGNTRTEMADMATKAIVLPRGTSPSPIQ